MKKIVILGGGFGGVYTALHLEKALKKYRDSIEIILVNRENYFTYQPMLAEVVGGSIDILDSVTCLRSLLKHTSIYIREVTSINTETKEITLSPNFSHKDVIINYDHLVLALGSVTDFRTSPGGLAEHALPFKDLSDALSLRNRIIDVIETAAQESDAKERKTLLTFVVGGGGFSGVEVVAEINDLARKKATKPSIQMILKSYLFIVKIGSLIESFLSH
jgi:NADH dehydrogenase